MGQKTRQSFFRAEQAAVREVLAELRQSAGLSQRQLSQRLGVADTFIARIERGERTLDLIEFIDIARATTGKPVEAFEQILKVLEGKP